MSTGIAINTAATNTAVERHRRRSGDRDLIRVEVKASKADAPLIRQVARGLRGGGPQAGVVREQLRQAVAATNPPVDLKSLLASAPLEGIDLSRSRDPGRTIDL